MTLSNYQLVLLDNLIYLGIFEELAKKTENNDVYVREVIDDLLIRDKISQYWKDELKEDQSDENPGQAMMDEFEWRAVLQAIAEDETLCSMKITNVVDADTDPRREDTNFRAACFSNDDETVIVFRGTTTGTITVTGHSKGGNLAQFVTICAANLSIDRCLSFDGQGFSLSA